MEKVISAHEPKLTTTLGDLIIAITEAALENGKSEEEGYQLASLALESILRRSHQQKIQQIIN